MFRFSIQSKFIYSNRIRYVAELLTTLSESGKLTSATFLWPSTEEVSESGKVTSFTSHWSSYSSTKVVSESEEVTSATSLWSNTEAEYLWTTESSTDGMILITLDSHFFVKYVKYYCY
jgi:hypothetical protein